MKPQLLTSTAFTMAAFSAIALPTAIAKSTIPANTERLRGARAAGLSQDQGQDQTADTLERLLQSSSGQNGRERSHGGGRRQRRSNRKSLAQFDPQLNL